MAIPSNLYAIASGTSSTDNLLSIQLPRDPTTNDSSDSNGKYPVGKRWINTLTRGEFYLSGYVSSNQISLPDWQILASNGPKGFAIDEIVVPTGDTPVPANGSNQVEFVAGSNITITGTVSAIPDVKQIRFDVTAPTSNLTFQTDGTDATPAANIIKIAGTAGSALTTDGATNVVTLIMEQPVVVAHGGTGISDYTTLPLTTNSVLLSPATGTPTGPLQTVDKAGVIAGQVLTLDNTLTPKWKTSAFISPLQTDDGGTGRGTVSANVLNFNQVITGPAVASGPVQQVSTSTVTAGKVLTTTATTALPSWTTTTYPSTVLAGSVLVGSAADQVTAIIPTPPTFPQYLTAPSAGFSPVWGPIDLASSGVKNTLPTTYGGTGLATPGTGPNANSVLIATGGTSLAQSPPGAAGQVLMSAGPSSPPTFQPLNAGFGSVTVQIKTSTAQSPYRPTTGMYQCMIEVVGGGGGGGSCGATSGSQVACAGGGGGGGYARILATAATIGDSQSVTVGAGGTAGAAGNNPGNAGGTTSVGAIISATGGAGGVGTAGSSGSVTSGGAGGTGSNGSFNTSGQPGGTGFGLSGFLMSGMGGSTFFGGGGLPKWNGAAGAGNAGVSYGGGGSGGAINASTAAVAGGAGAPGVIIITEYFLPAPIGALPTTIIVTSSPYQMNPNYTYLIKNATPANLTNVKLPATATVGETIKIVGNSSGGWRVLQWAGQQITFESDATTVGVGGSVSSSLYNDELEMMCVTTNTGWQITSATGNLSFI